MKVSQSRVKTWRRCRRAYHNKYVLGLRKKVQARPLKFGSLIHRMAEHQINGESWKKAIKELTPADHRLFETEREQYGHIVQDASDIMRAYVKHWADDGVTYIKIGGQRAEHVLEMDIGRGLTAIVIIDFIAKTENRLKWLGDHKTFTNMMSEEDMWRNLQSTLYHRAWEESGYRHKLEGTMWDMIHSKAPSEPQLTKTGKVSKSALVTLPATVRRFIRENPDIEPEEVAYLKEVAQECKSRYFKRYYIPRNSSVEKTLYGDFVETAREIQRGHGKRKARNVDRHCSWCEFKPLCAARLLDLDHGFVKRSQYLVDENRKKEFKEVETA